MQLLLDAAPSVCGPRTRRHESAGIRGWALATGPWRWLCKLALAGLFPLFPDGWRERMQSSPSIPSLGRCMVTQGHLVRHNASAPSLELSKELRQL